MTSSPALRRAAKSAVLISAVVFIAVTAFPQAAAKKETPPAKAG